jgi:hypothetical protein
MTMQGRAVDAQALRAAAADLVRLSSNITTVAYFYFGDDVTVRDIKRLDDLLRGAGLVDVTMAVCFRNDPKWYEVRCLELEPGEMVNGERTGWRALDRTERRQ